MSSVKEECKCLYDNLRDAVDVELNEFDMTIDSFMRCFLDDSVN